MSKVFFNGYGFRETKSWNCTYCNAFSTGGMDLMVDQAIVKHLAECPELETVAPRFTGFDGIELPKGNPKLTSHCLALSNYMAGIIDLATEIQKAALAEDENKLRSLLIDAYDSLRFAILYSYTTNSTTSAEKTQVCCKIF